MFQIPPYKFVSLGESALTVEFGNVISAEINAFAIGLSETIKSNPFKGLIDTVPCYSSVTVYFDPVLLAGKKREGESCVSFVKGIVEEEITNTKPGNRMMTAPVAIPVDFSDNAALDLESVAKDSGLSKAKVLDIFLSREYRVFMLGFLPGFPYMGEVDGRIVARRLETPRQTVPAGSVGIAGLQTGVYPFESPGGWKIIGRTKMDMFLHGREKPTLLSPGDLVKFVRA